MIVGTGADLAEVRRIKAAIERYGERFTGRVFTAAEIAYAESKANKYERYAARFAAKEAGMKALGTGWSGGVTFRSIEVVNLASGQPTLVLHGASEERARSLGATRAAVTISHDGGYAMACVVLSGPDGG